jgi:hypothetical protein
LTKIKERPDRYPSGLELVSSQKTDCVEMRSNGEDNEELDENENSEMNEK